MTNMLAGEAFQQKLSQCIHCGLCLQACPTYRLLGSEMDSPRGRIALMRAAATNLLDREELENQFNQHIQRCLACRSCETACPSGVEYGWLVERARVQVETTRKISRGERLLHWIGMDVLMAHPNRLKMLSRFIRVYQRSGFQSLVRRSQLLPGTLRRMEDLLPLVDVRPRSEVIPDRNRQQTKTGVLLFLGCIQDSFLSKVNRATQQVLMRNGYKVLLPTEQTCCGAAHLHLGNLSQARQLARKNIAAFLAYPDCQYIINNAGGCGLALKEYPELLADDPIFAPLAVEFSKKVIDISEFLVQHLAVQPAQELPLRVTYADSCHLRHGQKVIDPPRELVKLIPGLEFIELDQPDQCCGSAGVYNLAQADIADAVLAAKIADISETRAEVVLTSNPGCQLQLIAGLRNAGSKAKVMHVVEILEIAYNDPAAGLKGPHN